MELRDYCLSLPDVSEDTPFDLTTLCFRVNNKIFAMAATESKPCRVNLKCNPERALDLRADYTSILPGYHCNKQHWNTVILDDSIPNELAQKMVNHSYTLIFQSLKVKDKKVLLETYPAINEIINANF